jgi:hypothetical protein
MLEGRKAGGCLLDRKLTVYMYSSQHSLIKRCCSSGRPSVAVARASQGGRMRTNQAAYRCATLAHLLSSSISIPGRDSHAWRLTTHNVRDYV